jgi:transcription antitermination factor NusG
MREVEAFLPLYAAMHRWNNGCKVKVELPLFPNYVFVRIPQQERVRVLEAPGVLSLVGSGRGPSALPDSEIEVLRTSLPLRKFEPHPYLAVGERVRIKSGPMVGMEGVLLRKRNNFRLVLTLTNVMRSVAVEVDADEVEPLRSFRRQFCKIPDSV